MKLNKKALIDPKTKVIGTVVIGLCMLLALLIAALYWTQNLHITQNQKEKNHAFAQLFQHEIENHTDKFSFLINTFIIPNTQIMAAFRNRNHDELFNLTRDLFSEWKNADDVTHLYFHDAERINLLRVHQPHRHGDHIDRFTLLEAESSEKPSYGYELGALGTLTLRTVHPWFDGNTLLGYVEIGTEISHLLEHHPSLVNTGTITTIDKQYLSQAEYETGMKMLGRTKVWGEFKSIVVISSSIPLTDALHSFLENNNLENLSNGRVHTLFHNEKYYSASDIPLHDAGKRNIGSIYILSDISKETLFSQQAALVIIGVGILIMVLFMIVFRSLYNSAEQKLRILSSAVEETGESVMITNRDGIIEYVNPAFTKITGHLPEEIIGKTPKILKSTAQEPIFYKELWDTITAGEIWRGTLTDMRKDGSYFPVMMSIAPIHNGHKQITHFVSLQQDMTEYKKMEDQFLQAQKMEAIGTLVGGIAHDFNNMLAAIQGNVYISKSKLKNQPEVRAKLDNMELLSIRAANMVKQLLTFARKDRVIMAPFSLNSFMKEGFKLAKSAIPENIEHICDTCSEELIVKGDITQLQQALMNLLNNASYAVSGTPEPKITCSIRPFVATDEFIQTHPDLSNIQFARLSVQDNGCGITRERLNKVFDPFYTTKGVGQGTGLGLAMVYGSIQTHGGVVDVESEPGKGTVFHVYLPLYHAEKVPIKTETPKIVSGQQETVLLADDEDAMRETIAEVLISLGYIVIEARDGKEALQLFQEHDIDLVISDIVMPNMNGTDAVKKMRETNSKLPIIFMTGYDKTQAISATNDIDGMIILSKPFPFEELSHALRSLLEVNNHA